VEGCWVVGKGRKKRTERDSSTRESGGVPVHAPYLMRPRFPDAVFYLVTEEMEKIDYVTH